jgi:energy-converting hydrogenase Eha subunit B
MSSINDLPWKPHNLHSGEHARVTFPNDYGASVLRGGEPYTYTRGGTYELAVFYGNKLCYDSGITEDVLGYLSADEVITTLNRIENLPPRSK